MSNTDKSEDYNEGFLAGLLKAIDIAESYREREMFLGGIDEANGVYQAKRQITKYLENFLAQN